MLGYHAEANSEGGNSTPSYTRCVGSNWRDMGPFWREGRGVPLYGLF